MQKLRHLRRRTLLAGGAALALVLVTFMAFIAPRTAVAEDTNLIQGADVVAFSSQDETNPTRTPDGIVDGADNYWISQNMKDGTSADQVQTPQWVVFDLGEDFSFTRVATVELFRTFAAASGLGD